MRNISADGNDVVTVAATNDVYKSGNVLGNTYYEFDIGDIRVPVRYLRYKEASGSLQNTLTELRDAGPQIGLNSNGSDAEFLYNQSSSRFTVLSGPTRTDYSPTHSVFQRVLRYQDTSKGITVHLTQYWTLYWQKRSFQFSTGIQNLSNKRVYLANYQLDPFCGGGQGCQMSHLNYLDNLHSSSMPPGIYRIEQPFTTYSFRRTYGARPMFFARNSSNTQGFAVALLPNLPVSGAGQITMANHGYHHSPPQPPIIRYYWGGAWSNSVTGAETNPLPFDHQESRYIAYTIAFWQGAFEQKYPNIWADLQQPGARKSGVYLGGHLFTLNYSDLDTAAERNTILPWLQSAGTKVIVLMMPDFLDISHGMSLGGNYNAIPPQLGNIVTEAHNRNMKVLLWFSLTGILHNPNAHASCSGHNGGSPDPLHSSNWQLTDSGGGVTYWNGCYVRMDPFKSNAWYKWVLSKINNDLTWSDIDGFYIDEPTVHHLRHWNSTEEKTVTAKYIELLEDVYEAVHQDNPNNLVIINDRMPTGRAFFHNDYMALEGIPYNDLTAAHNYLFWTKPAGHAARHGWNTASMTEHSVGNYAPPNADKPTQRAEWACNNLDVMIGGGAWFKWYTYNYTTSAYLSRLNAIKNCY